MPGFIALLFVIAPLVIFVTLGATGHVGLAILFVVVMLVLVAVTSLL